MCGGIFGLLAFSTYNFAISAVSANSSIPPFLLNIPSHIPHFAVLCQILYSMTRHFDLYLKCGTYMVLLVCRHAGKRFKFLVYYAIHLHA